MAASCGKNGRAVRAVGLLTAVFLILSFFFSLYMAVSPSGFYSDRPAADFQDGVKTGSFASLPSDIPRLEAGKSLQIARPVTETVVLTGWCTVGLLALYQIAQLLRRIRRMKPGELLRRISLLSIRIGGHAPPVCPFFSEFR